MLTVASGMRWRKALLLTECYSVLSIHGVTQHNYSVKVIIIACYMCLAKVSEKLISTCSN
jgi:hypothetical protein